jgi:hypothetical protein
LLDASDHPIPGATVAFRYLPGFDDSAMIHRVVTGAIPAEARFVQVGLRIGMEGSRAGTAQLKIGPTRYREEGEGGLASVFDFEEGTHGWGTKGTAICTTTKNGTIEISATPGQTYLLNSKIVPATGARVFRCEFDVEVFPSTETGYLVVFFFDAARKVIARIQEPLVTNEARGVQNGVTDADGKIEFPLSSPELKAAREYRLSYPGDERHRPAFTVIK